MFIYKQVSFESISFILLIQIYQMPGIPNSLTGHSANLMARAGRTCTTQICKDAASAILQDLDLNVDPCDDFYQYTCKLNMQVINQIINNYGI
jgi:hypothetical protein